MSDRRRPKKFVWILPAVAFVLAGHLLAIRYALSRIALPAAVLSGVVVLIVVKHLGAAALFGPLYIRFRRRGRWRSY